MPESLQPVLISALAPSRAQKRAAFLVGLLLLALFLAVLPFARVQLGQLDVFLPIAATIMFLIDAITAALLYAQFSVLRSRALLVLANGYLFTALIVVAYALTFPGAFAPTGLLGAGLQTSAWLFTIWHMGFPAAIIAYAVLGRVSAGTQLARSSVSTAILASIPGIGALVCGVVWFVIAHEEMLPVIVVTATNPGGAVKIISAVMLTFCASAFVLLWFSRRSVLDLWLLVVSLAWLFSSILINLVGHRFDVAWYSNRIFAIMSASFVLFVLLAESTMLYARLALSVLAQRREREAQLMTLDAMSAAIAHEINQPLGAIVMNANTGLLYLNKASPDLNEARDSFTQINADGQRASKVIEAIRAIFSRGEQAETLLDPNELIREAIALVRSDLEKASISIRLGLAPQLPSVHGHHGQLLQVILNLVNNAADAMRVVNDRARVLTVKSESSKPNGIAISVADSGVGIDPKNMERIFDAFFTTKSDGMGIGLAICRSIVDRHGGTLSVSPSARHGSVFRVVLPGST
jgi:signal transduction histidine kinase